jgi:hypothetical protein
LTPSLRALPQRSAALSAAMATIELTPDHGYVLMVAGVVALQVCTR